MHQCAIYDSGKGGITCMFTETPHRTQHKVIFSDLIFDFLSLIHVGRFVFICHSLSISPTPSIPGDISDEERSWNGVNDKIKYHSISNQFFQILIYCPAATGTDTLESGYTCWSLCLKSGFDSLSWAWTLVAYSPLH